MNFSSVDQEGSNDKSGLNEANQEALHIAKLREQHTLQLIHSRNQLGIYAPYLIGYVVVIYMFCIILVSFSTCQPFKLTQTCIVPPLLENVSSHSNISSAFHYFTTGAFGASVALVIMQILDSEKRGMVWNSQLYCTLIINCIAFLGQFSIATNLIHPIMNVFGRVTHLSRLMEWVSLVPMLMFMTFSLDIRNKDDATLLWMHTICQQFSVACGCFANITSNYTFAIVLLVLSCISFCSIYVAVYFAFRRIRAITAEAIDKELEGKSEAEILATKTRSIQDISPIKISEILANVENVGVVMSFQLTIYCALFWTLIALTYFIGAFDLINNDMEACIQAGTDFLTKCFYVQVLCTSHGTVLSPEGILMRLLILEEKANAAFRQSIRFVFHELSTPLNSLNMGIETLSHQPLSISGADMLRVVKTSSENISDSLNDVRYLQSIENIDLDLKSQPFNLKALIKDTAKSHVENAKTVGVMLLLAIDARIPELLLGDKARLKPVISCFILNGINLCVRPGGTCTVMATIVESTISTRFGVRFSVKDDGVGLTKEEYEMLYNQLNRSNRRSNSIALHPFKKIISAHGGIIDVQTSSKGAVFSFEIQYDLPGEVPATMELLNRSPPTRSKEKLVDMDMPFNPAQNMESVRKIPATTKTQNYFSSPSTALSSSTYDSIANDHNNDSHDMGTSTSRLSPGALSALGTAVKKLNRESLEAHVIDTVLVVDDVLANRMMTGRVMQLMGFDIDYAEDGEVAVDRCLKKKYVLTIMDNMMPIMTGKDATKKLRSLNYDGLILGLTGNVLDEDLDEFRDSGCDEVITKPLDVPELKRTLNSLGVHIPKRS